MSRHQFAKAVAATTLTFTALNTGLLVTNSVASPAQASTVHAASMRLTWPDNTIWGYANT
jgi:hypothetical protein